MSRCGLILSIQSFHFEELVNNCRANPFHTYKKHLFCYSEVVIDCPLLRSPSKSAICRSNETASSTRAFRCSCVNNLSHRLQKKPLIFGSHSATGTVFVFFRNFRENFIFAKLRFRENKILTKWRNHSVDY